MFHVDENFVENEETWNKIKMAILGEESESESESGSEEEEESEESDEEEDEERPSRFSLNNPFEGGLVE